MDMDALFVFVMDEVVQFVMVIVELVGGSLHFVLI